eukprot:Unigene10335_Nuclearia_a/m.31567 Unigene10335_Nuclearia_a/g.31567  ORF Unigene10335_Nuclearia_a/g.31567 Unigene10335_Nuclearia_a/m.31567 type:complete len:335 (+) Unigene10335_Nuclearia_a:107-1111(+)
MDLNVLPYWLRLASLPRARLAPYTHHLLKFLLFPTEPGRFISFTETADEISLILEDAYLAEMARETTPEWLDVEPMTWRALQLVVGTAGQTASGIVSSLATPLAAHGISIFQLSTYDSDYALIEEPKLEAALAALKAELDVNIVLLDRADDAERSDHDADAAASDGAGPRSIRNAPESAVPSASGSLLSTSPQQRKHRPFTVTRHQIYLASIDRDNLEQLSGVLTRLIFYTSKQRFFSFTRNDELISIIVDTEAYALFPETSINVYPEERVVVRVADGPLGFEECGIVADFAQALADEKISIFYVSTFLTDYVLICTTDMPRAAQALTRRFSAI